MWYLFNVALNLSQVFSVVRDDVLLRFPLPIHFGFLRMFRGALIPICLVFLFGGKRCNFRDPVSLQDGSIQSFRMQWLL